MLERQQNISNSIVHHQQLFLSRLVRVSHQTPQVFQNQAKCTNTFIKLLGSCIHLHLSLSVEILPLVSQGQRLDIDGILFCN